MKFSLYFLQSLPAGAGAPAEPGSDAAHAALWSTPGVTLELTHNWGTETQADFKHHPGNEPGDGFGHLAFAVEDLEAACARLDAAGVRFKKRPAEGRMRTIAFVYDPDGYWVEIVEREKLGVTMGDTSAPPPYFSYAQTMLRVKDPKPSLAFYTERLGMRLVRATHAETFSIYFLATLPADAVLPEDLASPEAREFVKRELYPRCVPILELTHKCVAACVAGVFRCPSARARARGLISAPSFAQPWDGERPGVQARDGQRGGPPRLRAPGLPRPGRLRDDRRARGGRRPFRQAAGRGHHEGPRLRQRPGA